MDQGSSTVDLFQYSDYRQFLRDWYHESKKLRGSISFRSLARRAGFKSINFFKLVMEGKRNLTEESLVKVAAGLRLNKQEKDFFRNLVFFNQAKTHEEKDFYYQALLRSRKFSQLKPIEKDQYEYYSTWYHPVIRELVVSKDFDGSAAGLARRLSPPITPAQTEKSIALLEKLGFIQKADDGRWRQASSLVSTGAELSSHLVHNYHKVILDLTKEILDRVPATRRDISTMTLGVVKDRVPELKKKIQDFRQEILKLVSVDAHPEEVIQLNIQMFPLTLAAAESKVGDRI